ncbi:hypothetical protein RQP46_006504 [Phenoliferia psychrophenolica]
MLAFLSLVALAAAAPVVQRSAVADRNATSNTTSSVAWYLQAGNAGACGIYSQDVDFYNNTGAASPYCGSTIILTNLANNQSTSAKVLDASATPGLLSLSVAAWRAVGGDDSKFTSASWRFANATENAAAAALVLKKVESSTDAAPTSTEAVATTAETTYAVLSTDIPVPVPAYVAPTTATTTYAPEPTSTYVAPEKTYEEPSSTYVEPTTTYHADPTTTYSPPAVTTKAVAPSSDSQSYYGTATYFYQNGVAGNCGNVNQDSTYLIALDTRMYANGAHCGKTVTIHGNGKTIQAIVADSCPTCVSAGSIDLSEGAFKAIASLSDGVFPVTWNFAN